ncbi:enoyl-CoA hydratase [Paraglaciecola sp.]|uniref:enoyl-CoA hydratase n=1 Tax=Paraglaciecola sp. TaxID=1920173 RepID=UPI003267D82A
MPKINANSPNVILFDVQEGVAVVSINRPDELNTFTTEVINGLTKAFSLIANDDAIKVAVLTGTGRAFSAGLDLKMLSAESDVFQQHNQGQHTAFIKAISECPKPVIGAINGAAVAGGLELALCCDFLYASDKASFADTHAFVGVIPGWGLSQKFPRLVGINRARELSFTGRFFSAIEAKEWGLINEIYPRDELMNTVLDLALKITEADMPALMKIKALMNQGWNMNLKNALEYETQISVPYSKAIDMTQMEQRLEMLKSRTR